MTRDELATASELLEDAASATADEADADRLSGLSDQLARLVDADRGPDHGRLARIENALTELSDGASGEVADTIDAAHEHVVEYRSGVEGV